MTWRQASAWLSCFMWLLQRFLSQLKRSFVNCDETWYAAGPSVILLFLFLPMETYFQDVFSMISLCNALSFHLIIFYELKTWLHWIKMQWCPDISDAFWGLRWPCRQEALLMYAKYDPHWSGFCHGKYPMQTTFCIKTLTPSLFFFLIFSVFKLMHFSNPSETYQCQKLVTPLLWEFTNQPIQKQTKWN